MYAAHGYVNLPVIELDAVLVPGLSYTHANLPVVVRAGQADSSALHLGSVSAQLLLDHPAGLDLFRVGGWHGPEDALSAHVKDVDCLFFQDLNDVAGLPGLVFDPYTGMQTDGFRWCRAVVYVGPSVR